MARPPTLSQSAPIALPVAVELPATPPLLDQPRTRVRSRILRVFSSLAACGYPALVYFGLTHWSTRGVALAAIVISIAVGAMRFRLTKGRFDGTGLQVPAIAATLMAFAWLADDRRIMLAFPSLMSLSLFTVFASSLRSDQSIVERYARLQTSDLGDAQIAYCRSVTTIWCIFFAANGLLAAGLALAAPFPYWAFYSGFLAYLLIGVLFAAEFGVRRLRFGRSRTATPDSLSAMSVMRSSDDGKFA